MFTSRIIRPDEAMAAFGLIRLCHPTVGPDAWSGLVKRVTRRRPEPGGCIAVEDRRGCVFATALFRISPDLILDRRLELSHMASAALPAMNPREDLFAFADHMAAKEGCRAIMVLQAGDPGAIDPDLVGRGYRSQVLGVVKHANSNRA